MNSVQTLKSALAKLKLTKKGNEMLHSDWFLESLLSKNQGYVQKSTSNLKNLITKLNYVRKMIRLKKFKKGNNRNPFFILKKENISRTGGGISNTQFNISGS